MNKRQIGAAVEAVAEAARANGVTRCRVASPDGLDVEVEIGPRPNNPHEHSEALTAEQSRSLEAAAKRRRERTLYGAGSVLRRVALAEHDS